MKIKLGISLADKAEDRKPVFVKSEMLTKHLFISGASGSGKTGALLATVEENIRNNVPTILVDIKGDMGNIAQQTGSLKDKMNLRILTPGATHGTQINLFHGLNKPECVKNTVTSLLKMVNVPSDPIQSKQHPYLSQVLHKLQDNGEDVTIESLIQAVVDPPMLTMGAMDVDVAFKPALRVTLASKLNNLLSAPSFSHWLGGDELDIPTYLSRAGNRTNITIYSVAHLIDEDERTFALALLFDEIYGWMKKQTGHPDLRAMLVVDECVGILPPHPYNPPTKRPLLLLLKQARAFGLGIVVSSQNVKDLDYKSLTNCETWLIGRLPIKKDRQRLVDGIGSSTPIGDSALHAMIGGLRPREFLLVRPKACVRMQSIDVECDLTGPMTTFEMENLL